MQTATETDSTAVSRRSLGRAVVVGGTTLLLPQTVTVARGETDSGFVELETSGTIPTDTNIDVTIFEDTDDSGTSNRQQTESISDGTDTTPYDALQSFVAQGHTLWMDIQLSTEDDQATPELDSATITLPDEEAEEPEEVSPRDSQGLFELWDNPLVFISMSILTGGAVGLASKSLAIAAWGAYMIFAVFAVTTDYVLLQNIFYVTLVLIFVGFGFKLWRLEGDGKA